MKITLFFALYISIVILQTSSCLTEESDDYGQEVLRVRRFTCLDSRCSQKCRFNDHRGGYCKSGICTCI
ncbi:unnamed protein product [Tenebrio molitor]|nr:unnamed protein product [Tenebrio molitor]